MPKRPRPEHGRTTPKGTRPTEGRGPDAPATTPVQVLMDHARSAARNHTDINEAEGWASSIQAAFRPFGTPPRPAVIPMDALREARSDGGPGGAVLAAAMSVYGPESTRGRAADLFDKLMSTGVAVPAWANQLGQVEPTRTVMMSDIWNDSFSLHVDCLRNGETVGVGATIDSIGGIVAHGFTYGPDSPRLEKFVADDPDSFLTEVDAADARATVEAALAEADRSPQPDDQSNPDDADPGLRALIDQRFSLLPEGGTPLRRHEQLGDARQDLISRFLARPGVTDLADIEDLADTFCDFAGYCDGDPLRWSPSRVKAFMSIWVPAKVIADDDWYRSLPAAFTEWLRFAASEQDLSDHALELNLSTVDAAASKMQANRKDPTMSSPGADLMRKMMADGVDINDQSATRAWIDEHQADIADDPETQAGRM